MDSAQRRALLWRSEGSGELRAGQGIRLPMYIRTSAAPTGLSAREVALVVESATAFSRGVLRGVSQWMAQQAGWLITVDDRVIGAPIPGWLIGWSGDGVISGLPERALPKTWRGAERPVVYVRDRLTTERLPGIYPDDEAAVRLAVTHLVDRGLRHIGVCPVTPGTTLRCDAAVRFAAAAGCTVDAFAAEPRSGVRPKPGNKHGGSTLGRWLASLPRPVGVIAVDDVQVLNVLKACRDQGLEVPDDVAVVAVTDDDALGELATPAVTSVTHDRARLGREAARVLEHSMIAGRPASAVVLVPPAGIAVRRSSDVLAVADADIRRALTLIKERACSELSAGQVATSLGVSRKLLDRKFQQTLGRTIHDELQRTRLAEAKRLLAETDHKLLVVSVRAGFTHAAQLCNVFKAAVGMSPMEYRRTTQTCRRLAASAPAGRGR